MAMAPVAYTLWQRFLRFDPSDPIWPNRDRFVLSAGHASMLLYSLLHLTERAGRRSRLRDARRALGQPGRHQVVSPARLARRRPSRVPPDLRGRDDHRPPRPGDRDQRRDGDRRAVAEGALRRSALRLRRLRDLRRRRPDGGRLERGRVAGRPPAPRQPLLDLRQQPHHDRRPDRDHLHRRRRRPLHGLRLERHQGGRRERPRAAHPGVRGVQGGGGPAHADHRRQPHRLRIAPQAGHGRGARGAAGRGGGAGDQARLRLARGRPVPGPRRRLRALRRRGRGAWAPAASRLGAARCGRRTRRCRARSTRCSAASCRTAGTPRSRASTPDSERRSPPARRPTRC